MADKIMPTNALEIIEGLGATSLPNSPTSKGITAPQIKNAIDRPARLITQWLLALEDKQDYAGGAPKVLDAVPTGDELEKYEDGALTFVYDDDDILIYKKEDGAFVQKLSFAEIEDQIETLFGYFVNGKANTAGTADKAIADGNGNNIIDTYATKAYVNAKDGTSVHLSGDETIGGTKLFAGAIIMYNALISFNKKQAFAVGLNNPTSYSFPYSDDGGEHTIGTKEAIDALLNGDTPADKANKDGSGNTITSTYETKADASAKVALANLRTILGLASSSAQGLMSSDDKAHLDALYALLGAQDDSDAVVNTINEVLAIFAQYPEGVTLANALALKVAFSDVINNLTSNEINKPLSAYQGKVLNDRLEEVEENYVDHDDVFAAGMVSVTDYDESTGKITLRYNTSAVSINYTASTGVIKFTY